MKDEDIFAISEQRVAVQGPLEVCHDTQKNKKKKGNWETG